MTPEDRKADGNVERRVVNLRGWPGIDGWRPSHPPHGFVDRLGERNALVLCAAADKDAPDDTFGVGAALYVAGRSVVRGALLVPDDLGERAPLALAALRRWAVSRPVSDRPGASAWELLTLGEFFDPFAPVGCGRLAFTPNAYGAGVFVLGADFGRFLGLVAEHYAPTRPTRRRGDERPDGWTVYLPGWGKRRDDGSWYRRSPNRPELRLQRRRVGWQVSWRPCGSDGDGRRYGKARPGEWVDLCSLAYALDGDRGASFAEHRENLGLAPASVPLRVPVDATGAESMARTAFMLHETALVLDERASEWFTTPRERSQGRGRISLSRTASPGAIAAELLARVRVAAPLDHFRLDDAELAAWAESFHGGRCSFDRRFVRWPFPCAAYDLSSAFPLVAHLLDWWGALTAAELVATDVTDELTRLCAEAAKDPAAVLDPAVWCRFGLTLVEVHPDGEPWPIEVEDRRRPDGRMEVARVFSPRRALFYAWPDVVAATVVGGRVPRVVRATRLVPAGRQGQLRRRLPLLPVLVLDVEEDPALRLVAHRRRLKSADDASRAALLRVVVNALVFGVFARFDECRWQRLGGARVGERPGPWCFLPLASSVTAGSRLLLAAFEAMVHARGGEAVYCDTDSWLVAASPDGGRLRLPDGGTAALLSWSDLDEVAARFAPLGVFGPGVPVWRVARGIPDRPRQSVVFGSKRHVEFTLDETGALAIVPADGESAADLFERTDANLGGYYADPPAMLGRAADGGRRWSLAAAKREAIAALASQRDARNADDARPAWVPPDEPPAPAFFRRAVVTPGVLRSLPCALAARPGSRYVEALRGSVLDDAPAGPVALDPGDDLSDWATLRFVDRRTGAAVRVTTSELDIDAIGLATLDNQARRWSRTRPPEPIEHVEVEPASVRHVGRVSGVIDAAFDGLPGDPSRRRPRYAVRRQVGLCACGCGEALFRRGQRWFSNTHRVRASRSEALGSGSS